MNLISSIEMQFQLMINRRSFKFVYSTVLLYSLISYLYYVLLYKNADVFYYQTAQFLFCGNEFSAFWGIFEAVFPFLVVFPFAFSFIDDRNAGITSYIVGRMSKADYFVSKVLVNFMGGFLVIAVPFFLNLILCSITFPDNYNTMLGPYNSITYYEALTGSDVIINTEFKSLPMLGLYLYSTFLYNMAFVFILSFFAGILSMFAGACSFFLTKHKLLLFLPIYFIFVSGKILDSILRSQNDRVSYLNCRWITYAHVNFTAGRNYMVFAALVFILVFICLVLVRYASRKDMI